MHTTVKDDLHVAKSFKLASTTSQTHDRSGTSPSQTALLLKQSLASLFTSVSFYNLLKVAIL